MKPPVDNIRVSSKGRDILIQSKRITGLKQWNELLRWAYCLSLANSEAPKITRKLDSGIEPIEWETFAGNNGDIYMATFYARAIKDKVILSNPEETQLYFRAHIERGVAALRSFKTLSSLLTAKF
jgi:DNA sulfur modification protein DndE